MISHAIFCLFPSHPTPHRIVFHSASHPTLASRPALRSTSHPASRPSLHSTSHPALRPASRLSSTSHPALHSSPYSAQPCSHPASHHALHPAHRPPIPILIPQPSLFFFLPSSSPSLHVTPSSSRPPISHPRLSIPLCSSVKPLHPVFHPASHHALHPAHRPHSTPPISIALLCSPGFL